LKTKYFFLQFYVEKINKKNGSVPIIEVTIRLNFEFIKKRGLINTIIVIQ